jgi:hypothetical protein
MSTTNVISSLPIGTSRGVQIDSPKTAWAYSEWKVIDSSLTAACYISGFSFMNQLIPAVDTTIESLFEIGVGELGTPVMKMQIPISLRSDTAVGIYLPKTVVHFPEPYTVPINSSVYVRVADSLAANVGYGGVRLLIQSVNNQLISPADVKSTNYQGVNVPDGMSSSLGGLI